MAGREIVKPGDRAISSYYAKLNEMKDQHAPHEGAVSMAFYQLLNDTAGRVKWSVVTQQTMKTNGRQIRPDGILRDEWRLPHGYWEAKDSDDDLDREIENKKRDGYPLRNTIFEDTREAVLYQDGAEVLRIDMGERDELARLLNWFYEYEAPDFEQFEKAVEYFQAEIPELAKGLNEKIKQAHRDNKTFQAAYADFFEIAKNALNPNLRREAVDEMLIQHLLTERVIRTVFDNPDFVRRNVVACEIEKVINALTSQYFNRTEFLGALDHFYKAIEDAADDLTDFNEKQHFLNTVYERFFQGYSVEVADTHGIVYTPQEIVDFMCAAVEEALREEFGRELGDEGVNVLDPCTGTGNFIVNLIRRIPAQKLERAYREQLFANEVMLMPYYIASLNIEHEYYERTGRYEPFEGMCFVDTLDLAEGRQMRMSFITERNTERVQRQKQTPITVIIGNPPYNVGQLNENDNNKNRKYEIVDQRVRDTYAKDSAATAKNALYDAYVKFFRWATDRLGGNDGVVCFVSNNGFLEGIAFDGMRKHLSEDFNRIYVLDLKGDVRKDSMRDGIPIGEAHTVFGLAAMVGISITVLERNRQHDDHRIFYYAVDWKSKREEKFALLEKAGAPSRIDWTELIPDSRHTWLVPEHADTFTRYLPMGDKETKGSQKTETIFRTYSGGIKTNRDAVVHDFDRNALLYRMERFVEDYNAEVDRYRRVRDKGNIDDFVDPKKIKWDSTLKRHLSASKQGDYNPLLVRTSLYRPFTRLHLYFDRLFINSVHRQQYFFPTAAVEGENQIICVSGLGHDVFRCQIADCIVEFKYSNSTNGGSQCFPFYVYDEDGTNRRENITGWALDQFRAHYGDEKIDRWAIFYYVYGILHHPGYREKYADNLKRDLPRIPFAPDFWAFSEAGRQLARWHLDYEEVEPYELEGIVEEGARPDARPGGMYHVEKMRRSKSGSAVKVNDWLTLSGIPPEVDAYRLGNRSALDWVIDQYRIKEDRRTGIVHDPNDVENPRTIVELIGKVVRVSVETVGIVESLPDDFGG